MRVAADQIEELPVQSLRQSKVHLVLLAAGLDVRREDREDAFPGDVGAAGAGDGGGAAYLRGRRSGSLLRRQERGRRRNEGDARSPALQNSAQMGFRLSEFRSAARAALKRRALSSAASSVSKSSTGSKSRPATAAMASFGTLPAPARSELSKPASLGRASWRPAARASSAARTKGSSAAPQARRDGARTQLTPRKRRRAAANGKTTRRLRITRRRASGVGRKHDLRYTSRAERPKIVPYGLQNSWRSQTGSRHAARRARVPRGVQKTFPGASSISAIAPSLRSQSCTTAEQRTRARKLKASTARRATNGSGARRVAGRAKRHRSPLRVE